MASSALIAPILDPLVEPQYAGLDAGYNRVFARYPDEDRNRDYIRGFRKAITYGVDWSGDNILVASKEDRRLGLYDVNGELRHWPGEWMSFQAKPNDPNLVAAISWSGRFFVGDTRSSRNTIFDVELKKQNPAMKDFLYLTWSPDGRNIAMANRSYQIFLLDLAQQQVKIGASKSVQQEVNQITYSPDGDTLWIAAGGTPGKLHVYPTPSLAQESMAQVVAHQYCAMSLATDPQGRYIASGGSDCIVTLWDPRHLVCCKTFGYATQQVTTLGFNKSGSLLAWGTGQGSVGGEKNLSLASVDTGQLVWQEPTTAPVQQLKWHPTRNVVAYTLNMPQMPEEQRDSRGRVISRRADAIVHTLNVPEVSG